MFIYPQELRGLPGASVTVPAPSDFRHEAPLSTIPGSENDNQQYRQPDAWVNYHFCSICSDLQDSNITDQLFPELCVCR